MKLVCFMALTLETLAAGLAQAALDPAWEMIYAGLADESVEGQAVTRAADGNLIIAGAVWSPMGSEYYVSKRNVTNGAAVWERRGAAGFVFDVRALSVDRQDNIVLTGISASSFGGFDPTAVALTVKLACADGAKLWEHRDSAFSREYPISIAADASGNVLLAGSSDRKGDGFDLYVAQYAGSDGRLLWEKTIDDGGTGRDAGRWDHARAVAVDGAGDVVVAGVLDNGTPNYGSDLYAAKLAGADGRVVWAQRYNGPANLNDFAERLIVDPAGDVIVAGASNNSDVYPDYDIYTAKHAAADGRLLWSHRYNSPLNQVEHVGDLALALDGRVIVTGTSATYDRSLGLLPDIGSAFTLAYASEDGSLAWIQHYDDETTRRSAAQAIATDSLGRIRIMRSFRRTPTLDAWGVLAITYDAQGNQLAVEHSGERAANAPGPRALAVDPAGATTLVGAVDGDLMSIHYSPPSPPGAGLPRIVAPPVSQVLAVGSAITFQVVAEGDGPFTYQWRHRGVMPVVLGGETNRVLELSNAQEWAAGGYSVEVRNAAGSVISPEAQLFAPARIASLASYAMGVPGTFGLIGGNAFFVVEAGGTGPFTYQWFFNGAPISGATLRYLALDVLQASHAGLYSVEVRGPYGSVRSSNRRLTLDAIQVVATPEDATVAESASVIFSVRARSARPVQYQWRRNEAPIPGATNEFLAFPQATLSDSADYRVVLANELASITSAVARLTVVPAQPIDQWTRRDAGVRSDLYGITFAQGLFVVVGDNGTILTSTDGASWTPRRSGVDSRLHGVGYGAGRFVAVGRNGTILTSTNGIDWVSQSLRTTIYFKQVAYGGGLYVIVGEDGALVTSPDGAIWTSPYNVRTSEHLTGVTFLDGRFVVVGEGRVNDDASAIQTSVDGQTWNLVPSGTGKNLRSVVSGAGRVVAVGNDGTVLTSVDADTWESAGAFLCTGMNLRGVSHGNGLWVAVGNAGVFDAILATSADGRNWICRPSHIEANLHGIAYGEGAFVAVGNDGAIVQSMNFTMSSLAVRRGPGRDGFELTVTGEIGRTYRVQATTSLADGPWADVFEFKNQQSSTTVFVDETAGGFERRFYRVVAP